MNIVAEYFSFEVKIQISFHKKKFTLSRFRPFVEEALKHFVVKKEL